MYSGTIASNKRTTIKENLSYFRAWKKENTASINEKSTLYNIKDALKMENELLEIFINTLVMLEKAKDK